MPAGAGEVLSADKSVSNRICYNLYLKDPIQPECPEQRYPVMLSLDVSGFPKEYSLSLETDICPERICKRLGVTLFWDALGRYSRLEYPQDLPFTKKNHSLFLEEDYVRMDELLKDENSILGVYPLSFFVMSSEPALDGVDGVTGATSLTARNAVVPGAAYTSWVLWHWVNGEVQEQLRAITSQHCRPDYINTCLLSGDSHFVKFALQYLLSNRVYDLQYQDACYQVLEEDRRENCQLVLQYLMDLPLDCNELNGRLIERLGVNAGSTQLILEYFEKGSGVSALTWEQMAERLQYVSDYYVIHQMLNLLERRGEDSEQIKQQVSLLLHHENRFIVRRVREFLNR